MQLVDLTDAELIDDSFTISYEVRKKAWMSFHDYIPDRAFILRNQMVLSFKDGGLWKHEKGIGFYGRAFKSYLTPVFTLNTQTKLVNFIVNFIKFKIDFYLEKRLLSKTIDTISFHNSYQSTSEIRLIPKTECQGWGANTARVGSYWAFNKIKDETDNHLKVTLHEKFDENVVNTKNYDCVKRKRIFVDDYIIVKMTTENDSGQMYFSDIEFNVTPLVV